MRKVVKSARIDTGGRESAMYQTLATGGITLGQCEKCMVANQFLSEREKKRKKRGNTLKQTKKETTTEKQRKKQLNKREEEKGG